MFSESNYERIQNNYLRFASYLLRKFSLIDRSRQDFFGFYGILVILDIKGIMKE
jgi:hypothetical protein